MPALKRIAVAILSLVNNMVFNTPSVNPATLAETSPVIAICPVADRLAALVVEATTQVGTQADIGAYEVQADLVWPTPDQITSEDGDTATFFVHLTSRPTANVMVTYTSDDPSEGRVLAGASGSYIHTHLDPRPAR